MARLYAATGDGIARLDETDGGWRVEVFLAGSGAQCLAVDPNDGNSVYAGLREGGVRRTADGGRTWLDCGLPAPGVFSLAVSAADGAVYAGTEPSALYRSDDGGVTWQDHRPGAQPDVHSLTWHPQVEGRAYEAGGGGAAWSEDGGETWRPADEGRDRHYTWSVAVDPGDPDVWYVSASTGPFAAHARRDPEAEIYRWREGRWRVLAGGLPEPLPAMPYALVATDGRMFAGLADGQVWESADRGDSWSACAFEGDDLTELHALAYAPT